MIRSIPNFIGKSSKLTCAGGRLEGSLSSVRSAQRVSREKQPPGQIVDAPKVQVPQPDLDQVDGEDDTCTSELQQKVKHLKKKFKDLHNQASDDLKKRKVLVPKIRPSLFVHCASDTQTDIDLVASHRHEIREAGDLSDILSGGRC